MNNVLRYNLESIGNSLFYMQLSNLPSTIYVLEGPKPLLTSNFYSLRVWGRSLSALRLEDGELFQVDSVKQAV